MRSSSRCRRSTSAPATQISPNCATLPPPSHPCCTSCHLRRLLWARTVSLSVSRPRSEWAVNQHRDSCALYVGFNPLSSFFAVAENESIGRVKFSCLQVHAASSVEWGTRGEPNAPCMA